MREYHIAVIPGDGIGKEVAPEGTKVLEMTAMVTGAFSLSYDTFPWGCEYFIEHGAMMPDDGLEILRHYDAIYFGAVGYPSVPDHVSLHGLRLPICQGFDQYVCYRPSQLIAGVESPLARWKAGEIDLVVIRENTEGEYSGAGGRVHRGLELELAVETACFTRTGIERVVRYAYELARQRRRSLISATKSNALQHGMTLWDEIVMQVGLDFPEVKTERVLIDALAARFVLRPDSLDVVVASNLFGDILTDLGAAVCGSLGLAPSGNINPKRTYPSMFEPVHGSAPDIFGKGIANPMGMIWSGALMLDFLGQREGANLILSGIKAVTAEREVLTPDLGGRASTTEVGTAIAEKVRVLGR